MGSLDFLKTFRSQNTVNSYKYSLKTFLSTIIKEQVEYTTLDKFADRYVSEKRDHQKDLEDFLVSIKEKPPKTVRLMMAAVKTFLLENEIELPQIFWRRLLGRVKGTRALTIDKVPSNAELRQILQHMPIHGKALFLTLATSGMRIGEALKLKIGDVELGEAPAKVSVRGDYTKTGNPRITFVSQEAKEALLEWLKVKEGYIKSAEGRSWKYGKETDENAIFPFESNSAYAVWRNAVRKAGLLQRDPTTSKFTLHPHVLRKFFRTKMGSIIPVDVAEALMGHEGYLTEVYRRYGVDELAEFYKRGESAILIFTNGAEVSKLRIEIEEKNKQLQTIINTLVAENQEIKGQLKDHQNARIRNKKERDELVHRLESLEGLVEQVICAREKELQ